MRYFYFRGVAKVQEYEEYFEKIIESKTCNHAEQILRKKLSEFNEIIVDEKHETDGLTMI